jgi:hypothetical protein
MEKSRFGKIGKIKKNPDSGKTQIWEKQEIGKIGKIQIWVKSKFGKSR